MVLEDYKRVVSSVILGISSNYIEDKIGEEIVLTMINLKDIGINIKRN